MVRDVHCVHANTNETIYQRAERGEIVLFYASKSHTPQRDITPAEFPGEYLVPPEKAYELRELILRGTSAGDIVDKLSLERADVRNFLGDYDSTLSVNYRKILDNT